MNRSNLVEQYRNSPSTSANPMTEEQADKPLTIDEEYQLWRSNVPLMYDFVSETNLTWPTLTLEWLPGSSQSTRQELILGTHTSEEEPNYLKIAAIDLPDEVVPGTEDREHDGVTKSNIKIIKKFRHEQEVTRARYMPQENNIIATINGSGTVFLYDRLKDGDEGPVSTLSYHEENGYGLSFNPKDKGKLLSGSDDSKIALWDVTTGSTKPISTWEACHEDIVNDCKWHELDSYTFGSVSEDGTLQLHDQRVKDSVTDKITTPCPFNTIAFSKHSTNLFAAAGTDSLIYLYDARRSSNALHAMPGHEGNVTNLEFYAEKDGVLMSSGEDRRAILWDLMEIGAEQVPDDADDGAPEVLMIHAGHRSPINDFSMNPNIPWLMATAEEENIVQVWKCSSKLPKVGGPPAVDVKMLE